MKSILYVGATLMIGASIYGFVDYKKSQNKQEFKNMYSAATNKPVEEPILDEPVVETKVPANITVADKTVSPVTKKTTAKTKKAVKKAKKKRKLNVRLFSRGGLDDEYIEAVKKVPISQEVQKQ